MCFMISFVYCSTHVSYLCMPAFFFQLVNQQFFRMAENKTAIVLIANGSEEMEAVISIDVLRRAGVSYACFFNNQFPLKTKY